MGQSDSCEHTRYRGRAHPLRSSMDIKHEHEIIPRIATRATYMAYSHAV
jgi:hypothetical protein